jgi:hypothetical protein
MGRCFRCESKMACASTNSVGLRQVAYIRRIINNYRLDMDVVHSLRFLLKPHHSFTALEVLLSPIFAEIFFKLGDVGKVLFGAVQELGQFADEVLTWEELMHHFIKSLLSFLVWLL